MAKGISLIQGNKYPKIGEATTYTVAGFYPGTVLPQDESTIKWKIYAEQSTGNWRELRGSERQGRQATFSFPQQWYGKKILIEAYLHTPEIKAPPGLIIMPVPGERKIDSIGFFDSNWNPLQQTPKYGQTLNVRINTINMLGEDLKISLWERDTYSDTGHDPTENTNVWDSEKTYTVTDPNGRVEFSMPLDLMWRLKADKGIFDIEGSEHEYYLLVKGAGARTKYSRQQNVRDEVDTSGTQNPSTPTPATNPPASQPSNPAAATQPVTNTPASAPANVSQQEPVTVGGVGANPPAPNTAVSPAVVNDVTVEGLIDAYFAKKEYTKKTTVSAGNFVYTILKNNNRTATDAQKTSIATAILGKPNVQDLVKEKRYTTIEAIKAGLTQAVYNENDTVTFETFKLEAEFVKVNSAPLESKLYLVAKAYVLEDKQATITVKEKDGLIKGAADAVLPILELTEEEMEQTATSGTVPGTEKLEFTGTIKDGMVKIPIHLRPKSEDDLKIWKDKLAKGIEDGTYTYKFVTANNINDEARRKRIAGIILNNIKTDTQTNKKIEDGKTAYQADIEASLELINYVEGAEISFPIYKKQPELLYLNVKATGEKEHNKDFLKAEGAYFSIGGCPRCLAKITKEEFEEMFPGVTTLFTRGTNSISGTTIDAFLVSLNNTLVEFKINTCIKKAFFLAQIAKETGTFGRIDEDLYYTTEAALHTFWSRESHPRLYTNPTEFFRSPEKLGNYVYRGVAENGDEASGDGYKFRGRGLIQITRKKGYRRFGSHVGQDLVANPDLLLEDLDLMTRSAGWYWKHGVLLNNGSEKDINTVAAAGNFTEATRLVHGSTSDVAAREVILNKIKTVLKTDDCQESGSDADIEYHIQSSGEIQYKIKDEKREYAAYFYHDSAGTIHSLGKFKLTKVKENYGGVYRDKLGKDTANIYLIDIRTVKQTYKKDAVGFTLTVNTSRYYMNDVTIAALYGAMMECNYDDFVFNGFSNEKGESVGGSQSHKNGMNGDLRYLRTDKAGGRTDLFDNGETLGWKGMDEARQNTFNNALHKFGWKSMLSQNYGDRKEKILDRCTNDSRNNHNDHLHIQGFAPTLTETT